MPKWVPVITALLIAMPPAAHTLVAALDKSSPANKSEKKSVAHK